ncbi:MAG: hypothetical protein B0D85_02650, partial [Candidatus Sedimenticola endophacoides]
EDEAEVTRASKTTNSLVEMLAWCLINGVIDQGTRFSLYPSGGPVTQEELHALTEIIRQQVALHKAHAEVPPEQLLAQP